MKPEETEPLVKLQASLRDKVSYDLKIVLMWTKLRSFCWVLNFEGIDWIISLLQMVSCLPLISL